MTRVFLIAGEASGDRLGAALMAGLRELAPEVAFAGVGGEAMTREGLESLFPMSELSVMGLTEVLGRLPRLLRLRARAVRAVLDWRPDVLVTIDSPDFCLSVARGVRAKAPVRICHYVAPSVWMWRPGRAARMARSVDQVLCLLPFEPPLMEAAGMRADFCGHPVVAEPLATPAEVSALREAEGLGAAPVLLVLPGSRVGEVTRLMPVFGGALAGLARARPDFRIVVPAAGPVAGLVREGVRGWPLRPVVLDPAVSGASARKRAAFGAADLALAASGTVTLELAAARVPMVVAYDMNRLSWEIMRRMALRDTVTLVNLVSGTRTIPEFLGPACRPAPIGEVLRTLASDPEARTAQVRAMDTTMERLGKGGEPPRLRAARAVLDGLAGR